MPMMPTAVVKAIKPTVPAGPGRTEFDNWHYGAETKVAVFRQVFNGVLHAWVANTPGPAEFIEVIWDKTS